jgi:hypothetical protein
MGVWTSTTPTGYFTVYPNAPSTLDLAGPFAAQSTNPSCGYRPSVKNWPTMPLPHAEVHRLDHPATVVGVGTVGGLFSRCRHEVVAKPAVELGKLLFRLREYAPKSRYSVKKRS